MILEIFPRDGKWHFKDAQGPRGQPHAESRGYAGDTIATVEALRWAARNGVKLEGIGGRPDKDYCRQNGVRIIHRAGRQGQGRAEKEALMASLWDDTRQNKVPLGEFKRRVREILADPSHGE